MLDLFFPSLQIDCSRSSVTVRRRDRFTQGIDAKSDSRRLDEHTPFGGVANALRAMLNGLRCQRALTTVSISDEWCRLFVVTPPANAMHRRDCDAALAMRFHHLYGDAQDAWVIQADWQLDTPFLGAAVPRALHATLLEIGTQYQLRYTRITTQSIAAWNRWHKQLQKGDWFGVVCADRLTVIATDDGRLRATFHQRLSMTDRHDAEWLTTCISREALRLDLPLPTRIVLCGDVPPVWLHHSNNLLRCVVLPNTSDLPRNVGVATDRVTA